MVEDNDVTLVNKDSGDEFVVNANFNCWSDGKCCWRQQYTGLPCKHALLAAIERMRSTHTDDEKKGMCQILVERRCNPNWRRDTYSASILPDIEIPERPEVKYAVSQQLKPVDKSYVCRFKEVIRYVPKKLIEKILNQLEHRALQPTNTSDLDSTSDSDSDTSAPLSTTDEHPTSTTDEHPTSTTDEHPTSNSGPTEQPTQRQFSNPERRKRKKGTLGLTNHRSRHRLT